MKNRVQQLLKMDPEDYDMMLFGMWSRWVENVTTTELEYQKVLSNPPVNKWYIRQLHVQEMNFIQKVTQFPNANLVWIQEQYNEFTYQVFALRPMPLLKEAIKTESKGGYMELHGIKVETKIFNLN